HAVRSAREQEQQRDHHREGHGAENHEREAVLGDAEHNRREAALHGRIVAHRPYLRYPGDGLTDQSIYNRVTPRTALGESREWSISRSQTSRRTCARWRTTS